MKRAGDPAMEELAERMQRLAKEHQELFGRLAAGERRFRRLARSVWAVQEEERRRLARELHDGVGQLLTALKQQLEQLRDELGRDGGAAGRLDEAVALAGEALADTRQLSRLLRPPILDDLGLEAALQGLTRSERERSGLAIELDLRGLAERLPGEYETLAFRLVQEALTNVVKHAGARLVEVSVTADERSLTVTVGDDGRGFDPGTATDAGVGLAAMRDRVELFGGRLRIETAPGAGARLEASVPLAEEDRP